MLAGTKLILRFWTNPQKYQMLLPAKCSHPKVLKLEVSLHGESGQD